MPYQPNEDPPVEFVEGEQVTAESLNEALDEARKGIVPLPTEAGVYLLTVTVSDGVPSYEWTEHV